MNKFQCIILAFIFSFSSLATQTYFGKFHKAPKVDNFGFEYYFVLTAKDGNTYKQIAYPAEFVSKDVKKGLTNIDSKQFRVELDISKKHLKVGESDQFVQVVQIKKAQEMNLSDLSTNKVPEYKIELTSPKSGKLSKDGINDNVTNALIFGAGAALLGSILLGK